jgi:hypothetical protein
LVQLRHEFPRFKLIGVEDSLAATGPHLELLHELDLGYLIGVKEGDPEALLAGVRTKLQAGEGTEFSSTDAHGIEPGYRFVNDLPWNPTHPQRRVNFLAGENKGESQLRLSWITDIELSQDTVERIMCGGRARWKIENETFNTLKNPGYNLEHNSGHGQQHLATVLGFLMMRAFLVDQVQELGCRLWQAARAHFRSRTSRWERLRVRFTGFYIPDWKTLGEAVATGHGPTVLAPDSS